MAPKLTPNPLEAVQVSRHQIPAYRLIPNTSLQNRPLLHYHSVFPADSSTSAATIETYISSVRGGVVPQWRYTMYSEDHFHSSTNEVLCIASGAAQCSFGHADNPEAYKPVLRKGDVIVVPAGVSHRLLEVKERPFEMVGCYPDGCRWDMCYGREGEEGKIKAIKELKWLEKDPVYGDKGPALEKS